MHSTDLMKDGERPELLLGVAAFAMTDAVRERASEFRSEKELVDLILAIATINVWNRLAISPRIPPASSVSSE